MGKHSHLGASGAERWMNCPGSVALIQALALPPSDAEDYRLNGQAAHDLAARCIKQEQDAWEFVGTKIELIEDGKPYTIVVDDEMSIAVQTYVDHVRPLRALGDKAGTMIAMVEEHISVPSFHKDFYGTIDFAVAVPGTDHHGQEVLHIRDLKYGEGIQVDAEDNPQLMYYAYGVLQELGECDKVVLGIVQPRGFHPDGPVRLWETTAEYIKAWATEQLLPAMLRTEMDNHLDAGEHCRFCPAKLVCPMLSGLFRAACTASNSTVVNVSDAALGRSYKYVQGVKMYIKAMEAEAHRRLLTGKYTGGVVKLVNKQARRVFKAKADVVFKSKFGAEALTTAEMKSPAEMEKISTEAAALVKEYAYTPDNGTTVALLDDRRPAVIVQSPTQTFSGAVSALTTGTDKAEDILAAPAEDDLFAPLPGNEDGLDVPAFLKRKA